MTNTVTVLAPIKLAADTTESDFLVASERFQNEFVRFQPGVLRRELVKQDEGEYLDIVQFRSCKDAEEVIEKEKTSAVCQSFFALMDLTAMNDSDLRIYSSLATYN